MECSSAHGVAGSHGALVRWLLGPRVQLTSGEHAGAAVGWVDAEGRASYAYPEITGYYLQWLAWHVGCVKSDPNVRQHTVAEAARRADAAQHWLLSWSRIGATPPTRLYLQGTQADWRNGALFFFDLAMVARGLASAADAGLIDIDNALVERISDLLLALIGEDGRFDACRPSGGQGELPGRWSTRRGPFLAKAASGVLFAATALNQMPRELYHAADATLTAALDSMTDAAQHETHPMLYAIEGALALPSHPAAVRTMARIREQLRDLLGRWSDTAYLPESLRDEGRVRLDIVAQAIRAATMLLDDDAGKQTIARMRRALATCVDPQRGIPFSPTDGAVQYNAWTAMFAEQALHAAAFVAGEASLRNRCACLV